PGGNRRGRERLVLGRRRFVERPSFSEEHEYVVTVLADGRAQIVRQPALGDDPASFEVQVDFKLAAGLEDGDGGFPAHQNVSRGLLGPPAVEFLASSASLPSLVSVVS